MLVLFLLAATMLPSQHAFATSRTIEVKKVEEARTSKGLQTKEQVKEKNALGAQSGTTSSDSTSPTSGSAPMMSLSIGGGTPQTEASGTKNPKTVTPTDPQNLNDQIAVQEKFEPIIKADQAKIDTDTIQLNADKAAAAKLDAVAAATLATKISAEAAQLKADQAQLDADIMAARASIAKIAGTKDAAAAELAAKNAAIAAAAATTAAATSNTAASTADAAALLAARTAAADAAIALAAKATANKAAQELAAKVAAATAAANAAPKKFSFICYTGPLSSPAFNAAKNVSFGVSSAHGFEFAITFDANNNIIEHEQYDGAFYTGANASSGTATPLYKKFTISPPRALPVGGGVGLEYGYSPTYPGGVYSNAWVDTYYWVTRTNSGLNALMTRSSISDGAMTYFNMTSQVSCQPK